MTCNTQVTPYSLPFLTVEVRISLLDAEVKAVNEALSRSGGLANDLAQAVHDNRVQRVHRKAR